MSYRFTTQNIPQLATWVGFDRMFDELERVTEHTRKITNWPPYNIKKLDENRFVIELACAGFSKTDVEITTEGDQLIIKGEMKPDESSFIHKGIAERNFERYFTIADSVVVKNAAMVNGFLKVFLENIIPESKKTKVVPIGETEDIQTVTDTKQFLTE